MFLAFAVTGFLLYGFFFAMFTRFEDKNIKIIQMKENVLHLTYYLSLCLVSLWNLNSSWWTSKEFLYEESLPVATFICGTEFGVYLAMLIAVWIEPRKTDVKLMTFHHLITAVIIGLCFIGNFLNACYIILLLHDMCDVPLLAMTIAKSIGKERYANCAYVMTVLSFVFYRLVFFPFVIYKAVEFGFRDYSQIIIAMTVCLWIMHVYWLSKLLKQGIRWCRGLPTYDFREK